MAVTWQIYINGVDKTSYVRNDLSEIPYIDANPDSSIKCTPFEFDFDDTFEPSNSDTVDVRRSSTTIFSGYIYDIQRDRALNLFYCKAYSQSFLLNNKIFSYTDFHTFNMDRVRNFASKIEGIVTGVPAFTYQIYTLSHGLLTGDLVAIETTSGLAIADTPYIVEKIDDNYFRMEESTGTPVIPANGSLYWVKLTSSTYYKPKAQTTQYNNCSLPQVLEYLYDSSGLVLDTSELSGYTTNTYALNNIGFDEKALSMINQSDLYDNDIDSLITCYQLLQDLTTKFDLVIIATALNNFKAYRSTSDYALTTNWGVQETNEVATETSYSCTAYYSSNRLKYYQPVEDYELPVYGELGSGGSTVNWYNNYMPVVFNATSTQINNGTDILFNANMITNEIDSITKDGAYIYQETALDLSVKNCFECFIIQIENSNSLNTSDTMLINKVSFT